MSCTIFQLKMFEQIRGTEGTAMHSTIPIFKSPAESLEADTCQPLTEAAARGEVRLRALVHGHYPGAKLPGGALPGLKTVGYWDAVRAQNWGLPWHQNEGIEITFLESGNLCFAAGEKEYTLQPDTLTITRPWQKHRVGNPLVSTSKLHWFILDVGVRRPNQKWRWPPWIVLSQPDLDQLMAILRCTEKPVWHAPGEIRQCFRAIGSAVDADSKGSSVSVLTVRLNEMLLVLLDLLRRKTSRLDRALTSSRRTVQMFLDDIAQHQQHLCMEWTVQAMAESCGLGITQFVHIVKQLTNMTPLHYLNNYRLRLAAKLLCEHPTDSVTDIAQACAFSSSQYFATVFRRRFGCSPTSFRAGGQRVCGSSELNMGVG